MVKKENLTPQAREMNFYGSEVAGLISGNIKLLTLRKPNAKYDFEVGEVIEANCTDSGDRVVLRVLDNIKKPLYEYSVPELLLDGYESVDQAAEDLRHFKGYEDVTVESEMQAVLTITEALFSSLPTEIQEVLLERGIGAVLDADQEFKELFWPAWCRWIVGKGGNVRDWREFLLVNDLVPYNGTTDEFDGMRACELEAILDQPDDPYYRLVVLMENN